MKTLKILASAHLFVVLASAQLSTGDALAKLKHEKPSINWKSQTAAVADVNCDAKPDTIIFGSDNATVYVGIVSGARGSKAEVLSFPINSHTQDGFCAAPVRITTYPLTCEAETGYLPGCKPVKKCQGFSVEDDECDPFNFYWDSNRKAFSWWRN